MMDNWIERLSIGLVEGTSRRGAIGRIGRGLVVVGAAVAGVSRLDSVYAACNTCGSTAGFGCTGGNVGCGGTGPGDCVGDPVIFDNNARCRDYGDVNGYFWNCCLNGRRYVCQDCCRRGGTRITRTIKRRHTSQPNC